MKPKIFVITDNHNWCWTTTAEEIAYHLPEFNFKLIPADQLRSTPMDCDLVYSRGYSASFAKHVPKHIPFIWTMATGGKRLAQRFDECEATGKRGAALVVQNKAAYDEAKSRGYSNVCIIPNGVNTSLFKPIVKQPKEFIVGFAGNNAGERNALKGLPYVNRACRELRLKVKHVTADKPVPHSDMPKFYQSISAYAQPSESEGCSNSVMEAMSCGLPCLICKDVGYHGEICRDARKHDFGEVLFVERNQASVEAALKSLTNPESLLRIRIELNARRFAMDHDWRFICDKFRDLFKDILSRPKLKVKKASPKTYVSCGTVGESKNQVVRLGDFTIDMEPVQWNKPFFDNLKNIKIPAIGYPVLIKQAQEITESDLASCKVIAIEKFDSCGIARRNVLKHPNCIRYVKQYALDSYDKYNEPTIDHRYFTRFLGKPEDMKQNPVLITPEDYVKIFLGFNFLDLEIMKPFIERAPDFSAKREIDIFFAGTVKYGDDKHRSGKLISKYRMDVVQALKKIKGLNVIAETGKVYPKDEYIDLMYNSKVVVSPYGFGEICYRDYESILAGCILVKSAIDFVDCRDLRKLKIPMLDMQVTPSSLASSAVMAVRSYDNIKLLLMEGRDALTKRSLDVRNIIQDIFNI